MDFSDMVWKSVSHGKPLLTRTWWLTHAGQAKKPPFCRQHFQINFLQWKLLFFYSNFTEICSLRSNWKYISISSDKGLGLALLMLSKDKNWDSHSPMNGYPSFYPRIALVAPSPGIKHTTSHFFIQWWHRSLMHIWMTGPQWVNSLAPGTFQFNFR